VNVFDQTGAEQQVELVKLSPPDVPVQVQFPGLQYQAQGF
jgi:hypothetical protein